MQLDGSDGGPLAEDGRREITVIVDSAAQLRHHNGIVDDQRIQIFSESSLISSLTVRTCKSQQSAATRT
jgi:hypothetical protein